MCMTMRTSIYPWPFQLKLPIDVNFIVGREDERSFWARWNNFACTPNHIFNVILDGFNGMEGLRSQRNGLVSPHAWSDGKKHYDNAFLCFQSWYTNTFSQESDSFSKHYRLLWEEPCASPTSVKLERQRK